MYTTVRVTDDTLMKLKLRGFELGSKSYDHTINKMLGGDKTYRPDSVSMDQAEALSLGNSRLRAELEGVKAELQSARLRSPATGLWAKLKDKLKMMGDTSMRASKVLGMMSEVEGEGQ